MEPFESHIQGVLFEDHINGEVCAERTSNSRGAVKEFIFTLFSISINRNRSFLS